MGLDISFSFETDALEIARGQGVIIQEQGTGDYETI
jgi:hypothetical protein